ncbi:hypothetical protein CDAR_615151 [Caerostris darwini]|uniref:Uncharacterized protein n=1 Tax=Caerostris darwini TaxID=1538125 RepID=A0AAV4R715_9ARAC|nr:hypothetical protein CDAR_615151 [Caerostris darwini]
MFQKKSQTGGKTRIILSSKSLPNDKWPLLNCALGVTELHKQAFTAEREKKSILAFNAQNILIVSSFLWNPYLRAGLNIKRLHGKYKREKGEGIDLPPQEKDKGQLHEQGKEGG